MTNILSNSIVVLDASTNGGVMVGALRMAPIFSGLAVSVAILISLTLLLVWFRKFK